jgi:hypothetical protein
MISVEKDRLEDGPFCVWQIDVSSDDSEAPFWYTAHKSGRTVGGCKLDPGGKTMAFNLYEGYLGARGRRTDATRDAEQR